MRSFYGKGLSRRRTAVHMSNMLEMNRGHEGMHWAWLPQNPSRPATTSPATGPHFSLPSVSAKTKKSKKRPAPHKKSKSWKQRKSDTWVATGETGAYFFSHRGFTSFDWEQVYLLTYTYLALIVHDTEYECIIYEYII